MVCMKQKKCIYLHANSIYVQCDLGGAVSVGEADGGGYFSTPILPISIVVSMFGEENCSAGKAFSHHLLFFRNSIPLSGVYPKLSMHAQ